MKGKAIIVSAPSGAGKTTIVKELMSRIPTLSFSISATTRKPRPNEIDGKDYYFMSFKQFQHKIENDELLEWEEVYRNIRYGTLKKEVERIWSDSKQVIFDVDVKGGMNLKTSLGADALSIFIKVRSIETLRKRLESRNTESDLVLEERVEKSLKEMKFESYFDSVLLNEHLHKVLNDAERLVRRFIVE